VSVTFIVTVVAGVRLVEVMEPVEGAMLCWVTVRGSVENVRVAVVGATAMGWLADVLKLESACHTTNQYDPSRLPNNTELTSEGKLCVNVGLRGT
jgi:hypothetical protein